MHLLRVANDLVIAGPRPGAHGPPWGDGHRPAVPREGSAVYADWARQTSRAIVVYQDSVHRLQRPPLTFLTVWQDVHRSLSGNGRGSYGVKRSAAASRNDKHRAIDEAVPQLAHPGRSLFGASLFRSAELCATVTRRRFDRVCEGCDIQGRHQHLPEIGIAAHSAS